MSVFSFADLNYISWPLSSSTSSSIQFTQSFKCVYQSYTTYTLPSSDHIHPVYSGWQNRWCYMSSLLGKINMQVHFISFWWQNIIYISYFTLQFTQMAECVYPSCMPREMTRWAMRQVPRGGVLCRVWRRSYCLLSPCWQVRGGSVIIGEESKTL